MKCRKTHKVLVGFFPGGACPTVPTRATISDRAVLGFSAIIYGELNYDIGEHLPDGSGLCHRTVRGVVAAEEAICTAGFQIEAIVSLASPKTESM